MRGSTSLIGLKASIIVSACIRRSAIKHQPMQSAASWLHDLVFVQSRQGHTSFQTPVVNKFARGISAFLGFRVNVVNLQHATSAQTTTPLFSNMSFRAIHAAQTSSYYSEAMSRLSKLRGY